MTNKILIFTTRHLCYSSGDFFAMRLADGFEAAGVECEYCNLEFSDNRENVDGTGVVESSNGVLTESSERQLESYLGKSYLAVIDFNSRMPHMILDDGSYYLDGIDAPFYDYILDHPLYHHSTLSCKLKNFHVIVLDRNQRDYVEQQYPWIRDIIWQPLGGQVAVSSCPLEQKREEVLFTGTYRDPGDVMNRILQTEDEVLRKLMLDMIDYMKADGSATVEQALEYVVSSKELESMRTAKLLNACYPVEIYIRNLYRENLIDAFVKNNIPLRIVGDWWERYTQKNNVGSNVTFQPAISFARSADMIAGAAILLDSSPFFQYGIHDRVTAAMANRTIALTDENAYIRELEHQNCANGQSQWAPCGICSYPVQNPQLAVEKAEYLLSNLHIRRELAEQAYELYQKGFTWNRVAENLLNIFGKRI